MQTKHPKGERGRFVTKVIGDKKYCRLCKEWKDLSNFGTRVVKSNGRTYYKSECRPCLREYEAARRRNATGEVRINRQEYERIYKEGKRRENGVAPRNWKTIRQVAERGEVPRSQPVWPLLSKYFAEDEVTGNTLNGFPISESHTRLIHRLRSGDADTMRLDALDELLHEYNLPLQLWEFE